LYSVKEPTPCSVDGSYMGPVSKAVPPTTALNKHHLTMEIRATCLASCPLLCLHTQLSSMVPRPHVRAREHSYELSITMLYALPADLARCGIRKPRDVSYMPVTKGCPSRTCKPTSDAEWCLAYRYTAGSLSLTLPYVIYATRRVLGRDARSACT
jgi:hypothetical protein